MATLGGVRSVAGTRTYLKRNLRHWQDHHFGLWVFRDATSGRFVGRGGLRRLTIHGWPEVEIAYALMANDWRRGLGTEIAAALVDVGTHLGLNDLIAFTRPDNHGSRRVMENAGFRYERDIVVMNAPYVLYRRRR